MEKNSKKAQAKVPLGALQTVMKISKVCNPAVLSHISTVQDYERIGTLVDIGQNAMERYEESRPAIAAMKSIQATAQIGELSQIAQHAMGYQGQVGTILDSCNSISHSVFDAETIVSAFDAAIGAQLPEQIALRGFQSSWPAIEAFNNQLVSFEKQGVPYAQIMENLRASDFVQRNNELLIKPAVQIYETCSRLPEIGTQVLGALTPIESIITNLNAAHLFNQLSPLLETVLASPPDKLFWRAYQRKCLCALMDAKWCPSLLSDLPEQEMIPLNKILAKKMSQEKQVEAIDRFVFKRFGRDYIVGILEKWPSLPISPDVRRLMCEAVKAYRRKEYGLVIHSLPVQWEGIIKEKAHLPERVSSAVLKDAVKMLVSENEYPRILSTFYEEFIMYQCYGVKDYIPDVPGRNAIAHGWLPEYPSRKAALNAILFTDFLLHLDKLEESSAS